MNLNEAYIDKIICHHFSLDPTRILLNSQVLGLMTLDVQTLNSFFVLPFGRLKSEYSFVHPVDLSYNVVYKTSLRILQDEDFVKCSQNLFRHLCTVSTIPTIKDGDFIVAQIDDIKVDNTYYQGLGIFKIESKNQFIETFLNDAGQMVFDVKSGFTQNKVDKGCLIVFTEKRPTCYIIEHGKDTKFWKDSFLGVAPVSNNYSQSKAVLGMVQEFVDSNSPSVQSLSKDAKINLINRCSDIIKSAKRMSVNQIAQELFAEQNLLEAFSEYQKLYEEREQITFQNTFVGDKTAVAASKTAKRIKLDDTSEIYLLKIGSFLERGYDEQKGMKYYKLYFNEEK